MSCRAAWHVGVRACAVAVWCAVVGCNPYMPELVRTVEYAPLARGDRFRLHYEKVSYAARPDPEHDWYRALLEWERRTALTRTLMTVDEWKVPKKSEDGGHVLREHELRVNAEQTRVWVVDVASRRTVASLDLRKREYLAGPHHDQPSWARPEAGRVLPEERRVDHPRGTPGVSTHANLKL